MIITFSHVVSGETVPLLYEDGREFTLQVNAATKTEAIYSQEVKEFCDKQTGLADVRVRTVT